MASRALATTTFLVIFNLLFFTLVSSTHTPKGCPPPPPPSCPPSPKPGPTPSPKSPPPSHKSPPPSPKSPTPKSPPPSPKSPPPTLPTPSPKSPPPSPKSPTPTPPTPSPKTPPPSPTSPTPSPPKATCPTDTLKLGVCANLLNDLLNLVVGSPPKTPCCSLIGGLADLEAAVCLCTAIKANVLGINLNVPVSLSLLLNYCGKNVPSGFQCA